MLNHRDSVADISINRRWLPGDYHFKAWNGGLLRGTLPYKDENNVYHILVYGTGGVWQTDSSTSTFSDFNKGLPDGADY